MEIYNETAKTKTGELRVTRSIGALLVKMSQPFSALTNETVTIFLERANGDNTELMTDIPLSALISASTAGAPAVFQDDAGMTALCEICEEGGIALQENESIKIKLDGLKSAVTYQLNGIEYPSSANSVVSLDRKTILTEESQRRFDVPDAELMLIEGVDEILEMNVSFANGTTCKYTPDELRILSRDFDPVKVVTVGTTPSTAYDLTGLVTFPLIAVLNVDIKKKVTGAVKLYLKNDKKQF